MHLEHINMTVRDLDASIDFYCRLLGLDVRWRRPEGEPSPAAHVGNDAFYIALFQADDPEEPAAPRDYGKLGMNHAGFVVEDLDAAKSRLLDLGATPHQEADYEPGRRLYFLDPSGIEIELVEYETVVSSA